MTTRILHLSDLHFGDDHYFRQSDNDPDSFDLADAITETLARAKVSPPDAVIITGDLLSKKQSDDLSRAKEGLDKLMSKFFQSGIPKERFHFVPGNRDCSWGAQDTPFQFYDELLASISPSPIQRDALPRVVPLTGSGRPDIDLILLDSCRLGTQPATKDLARVGEKQLGKVRAALEESGTALRIAALHHHLLPVWGVDQIWNPEDPHGAPIGSVSFTVDALNVLKELAGWGVRVVLHGHQHKPLIARLESYLGRPYAIVVIGAGSAGAKQEGRVPPQRQFFLHEIEPDTIRCHSFQQSHDNASLFEPHKETSAVVALVDPIQDGHRCLVDLRATRYRLSALPIKEEEIRDRSDLFYLLLSVVDCDRSRDLIRDIERSWHAKGTAEPPDLVVTGIYYLMGKWDLLVRYRSRKKSEEFEQEVLKTLHDAKELEWKGEKPVASRKDDYFPKYFSDEESMDVIYEPPVSSLAGGPSGNPDRRRRTFLGSTYQYESQRCHRAFIYIPCDESRKRRDVFEKLQRDLKEFESESGIIESYAFSRKEIMIEIFLTCSQMVLLNKLNRALGKCLAGEHVQKYTLSCYGYDDRSAAEGVAEGLEAGCGDGQGDGKSVFPILLEKPAGPPGAPASS